MRKKQAPPNEENLEEKIKTIASEFISKLQVEATIEVTREPSDHFKIVLQTSETGLLIGYHGETINSLQLLLGVILYKKLGKWIHVVVDVGGYRKMREESIKEMIKKIVSEVESTGQPATLPFLTPLERRIVHMTLADNPRVASESFGEGKERRVMIKSR